MILYDIVQLIRVRQWYKNIVIFLAIFFSGNILNQSYLYLTIFGFFSLSFISSAGYIINDFVDIRQDRLHPERKNRPLASKKVSLFTAFSVFLFLVVIGLCLAWIIGPFFFLSVLSLFTLSLFYTFILKQILLADVLTISTLFVIRAISGALIINVWVSPWLILCPFFLSLFFSVGKRHSDLLFLSIKAKSTRKVLAKYSSDLTIGLMNISTTLLIISYALYSFLSNQINLMYTLPFALFCIFRYYYLTITGSKIARHPEKIYLDVPLISVGVLFVSFLFILLYLF